MPCHGHGFVPSKLVVVGETNNMNSGILPLEGICRHRCVFNKAQDAIELTGARMNTPSSLKNFNEWLVAETSTPRVVVYKWVVTSFYDLRRSQWEGGFRGESRDILGNKLLTAEGPSSFKYRGGFACTHN
jgi:hypothetical protein